MNFFKKFFGKKSNTIESTQVEVTKTEVAKEPRYTCYLEIVYKNIMGNSSTVTMGHTNYTLTKSDFDVEFKHNQTAINELYSQLENNDIKFLKINDALLINKSDFLRATILFSSNKHQ